MKRRCLLLCIALLAITGCNKTDDPPSASQQEINPAAQMAAEEAAAEERAARIHLTASMTDLEILRAIGIDPALVKLAPAPEGYGGADFIKTAYTNATIDIEISRVPSAGRLLVNQMDHGTRWIVKGKSP
jgi:hypothetical protein